MEHASTVGLKPQTIPPGPPALHGSLGTLLWIAVAFGMMAGLVEALLPLIFQRINWEHWGQMVHTSYEILWISPVVDALLFTAVTIALTLAARIFPRIPAFRAVVFVLVFLTAYDWLILPERLYHRACVLLALGIASVFTRSVGKNRPALVRFSKTATIWLAAIGMTTLAAAQVARWTSERTQVANLPAAANGTPNVLVIVVDTLRADHLSSYGYSRPTPSLDRIAREGALFENLISACSWTLPSHASMLTGRYPSDHGMGNLQPIPWLGWGRKGMHGYTTLGEALQGLGYSTAAFSANQGYFTANVGLGRGFIHFEDYFQSPKDMLFRTLVGREFERIYLRRSRKSKITRAIYSLGLTTLLDDRKRAREVNREMLAWVDRQRHPFFAFLNYMDVHDASALPWGRSRPAWGDQNRADQYDSALNYVDAEIGALLGQLEARKLLGNTLVIVTSDHGESLGQHAMQYHGIALYREQLHVPLLVWYPGRVPAGTRVTTPVSNTALAGTIMDLAGGRIGMFPAEGLDLLWKDSSRKATRPYPISELPRNEIMSDPDPRARSIEPTSLDGDMRSVMTPKWHLIVHQTLGEQLYDWVSDPAETRNLIASPEGDAVRETLETELGNRSH